MAPRNEQRHEGRMKYDTNRKATPPNDGKLTKNERQMTTTKYGNGSRPNERDNGHNKYTTQRKTQRTTKRT